MNPVDVTLDSLRVAQSDRAHLAPLVEQLSRELADAQAAAEVERSNLKAALDRSCTTVLQLTAKNAEERSATRRLCGQQVQLVKALRALVDVFCQNESHGLRDFDSSVLLKALSEAREVLRLVEVPFA